jgi:ABC-type lipoprotein export system ATPase subunit
MTDRSSERLDLDLFGELNTSGMTVVMVTHETEVAKQTQRIVWLMDGKVVHSHLHSRGDVRSSSPLEDNESIRVAIALQNRT